MLSSSLPEEEGKSSENVAFQQLEYLYALAKKELDMRRLQTREQKIRLMELQHVNDNHKKTWALRESDLRENFARASVHMKKAVENSAREILSLKEAADGKEKTLASAESKIRELQKENEQLKTWKKDHEGKQSKFLQDLEQHHQDEIKKIKVELARAVRAKIERMELRHKQELFLATKRK
jgi:hypothetical protein